MARTAIDYTTTTKTARAKLDACPKPYYRQIGPGKTLGYVRRDSGPGAWVVRERMAGRYTFRTLGAADDLAAADGRDVLTFEQAMRAATRANATAPVGRLTLRGALDVYRPRSPVAANTPTTSEAVSTSTFRPRCSIAESTASLKQRSKRGRRAWCARIRTPRGARRIAQTASGRPCAPR
jgi:hypothetical protein